MFVSQGNLAYLSGLMFFNFIINIYAVSVDQIKEFCQVEIPRAYYDPFSKSCIMKIGERFDHLALPNHLVEEVIGCPMNSKKVDSKCSCNPGYRASLDNKRCEPGALLHNQDCKSWPENCNELRGLVCGGEENRFKCECKKPLLVWNKEFKLCHTRDGCGAINPGSTYNEKTLRCDFQR